MLGVSVGRRTCRSSGRDQAGTGDVGKTRTLPIASSRPACRRLMHFLGPTSRRSVRPQGGDRKRDRACSSVPARPNGREGHRRASRTVQKDARCGLVPKPHPSSRANATLKQRCFSNDVHIRARTSRHAGVQATVLTHAARREHGAPLRDGDGWRPPRSRRNGRARDEPGQGIITSIAFPEEVELAQGPEMESRSDARDHSEARALVLELRTAGRRLAWLCCCSTSGVGPSGRARR